jgi:hypothetical protein
MIAVGPAPRCRIPPQSGQGKDRDVLQVSSIWANLDNRKASGGAVEVVGRIAELLLRPSVVVNSGYGFHVYFAFHSPLRLGRLLDWSRLSLEFRDLLGCEDRVTLSQVMRLPGTFNVKEPIPVLCEVVEEYTSWTRYSLDEVRRAVEGARRRATPVGTDSRGKRDEVALRGERANAISSGAPPALGEEAADDGESVHLYQALPHGYALEVDGSVWFNPQAAEHGRRAPKPVKVSDSPIRIAGIQEDVDTGQISLLVSFDYLGASRTVSITRSEMSDSRRLVAALSGAGAPVSSNNARLVTSYLAAYEHAFARGLPHKRLTSRFGRGRAGGPFFLPGLLSSSVEFEPRGSGDASLWRAYSSRRGTLRGWLQAMRAVADGGLMIPQVTVLAALVPPLQRLVQIPNFILDLYGGTSTGKSTSLKMAASVYGRPEEPDSLLLQWMNTSAALEQVAWVCGELPIFLDDAQHCPAALKRSVVYMIANGRGKGRGGGGSMKGLRETSTWHTVALSTSEEPLHESSPHEGARGRILPVGGLVPPFPRGSAELVQAVERAVAANHGHAGEAFIRHLNCWTEVEWIRCRGRYSEIRTELLRSSSSDLLGRVSGYIASIQLAAEAACPLLGLPFKPDVVAAWLRIHLEEQQSNQNVLLTALRDLADFYVSNIQHFAGDGCYNPTKRASIFGAARRHQHVGFLRSAVNAALRQRGWGQTAVLNKMAEAGVLLATEGDRHTKKVSVEGVKHRMICVKWSALFPDDP